MNSKFFFVLLFLLPLSLIAMDKPLARKNVDEATETEQAEETKQAKKAAREKKHGTVLTGIHVKPQFASTQMMQQQHEQKELAEIKKIVTNVLTGGQTQRIDYEMINTLLEQMASSINMDINLEASLLLGHHALYAWGQPQNFKLAEQYYAKAAAHASPVQEEALYYKKAASLAQHIEYVLQKKSLSLAQQLQEIQSLIQKSPYPADVRFHKLIIGLIQTMNPESNIVANALEIGTPGAYGALQELLIQIPAYYNQVIEFIKLALFADNQPLLTKIYRDFPPIKNLIDQQLLEIAIAHNLLHDVQMFIAAGASPQSALAIAQRVGNINVIKWLDPQSNIPVAPPVPAPSAPAVKKKPLPSGQPTFTLDTPTTPNESLIALIQQRKPQLTERLNTLIQKMGANINYVDEHNNSPLAQAIKNNDPKIVKWLLEHGADPLATHPEHGSLLENTNDPEIKKLIEDFLLNRFKVLSSPVKPTAVPAARPKVVPFKGFEEKQ